MSEKVRRYADLSERVTVSYYDDEFQEWSQKTKTVEDVLNEVCEDFQVVTFEEPEKTDDVTKSQILNMLYEDLGCFAGDMLAYQKEIRSLRPYDEDWNGAVNRNNEAAVKKRYVEELINKIEKISVD